MEEYLIIDGYNIIGDWSELRALKKKGQLDEARDELLSWLVEYKAYSGKNVIVVFDAYKVPGVGKRFNNKQITVYYTKENETADELIEKLVKELYSKKRRIYVATSDYTEQNVTFGQGALRISARELAIEKQLTKTSINKSVENRNKKMKRDILSNLDEEMIKYLESLRRKR